MASSEQSPEDRLWDEVHDARVHAFEAGFGKLPQDIQKMMNLSGIWPGGGLYVIPAPQLGTDAAVYASFGLSNPDMPSTLTIGQSESTLSEDGERLERIATTIIQKEQLPPVRDWPGYGYEIIVLGQDNQDWPLSLLQWAVQAEILNDVGMRDRMDTYGGLTVESVRISDDAAAHLLISRAQPPLMTHLDLPTGQADIIVITVITAEEMLWSKQHGREELLAHLMAAGIGQFSVLERPSVVALPDIGAHRIITLDASQELDFSGVTSREQALALVEQGELEIILSFPDRFGGEDVAMNQFFVPPGVRALKDGVTDELVEAVEMGLIDNLGVQAEYKGSSFVPASILIEGTHSENEGRFDRTIQIW